MQTDMNPRLILCVKYLKRFQIAMLVLTILSCDNFLQIDPPKDELSTPTVFLSDAAAESAVRGIYSVLGSQNSFAGGAGSTISGLLGVAADELTSSVASYAEHQENSLLPTNADVASNWTSLYRVIYLANGVIEGIRNSNGLSAALATNLEGEAKFIRAFCYFHLVNLWGDVPLMLTSDYRQNMLASRVPSGEVWEQIVSDLVDAQTMLPDGVDLAGALRVRANKWAATAMLSRTYLFLEEWEKAEMEATSIIENSTFSLEPDLSDVFLIESREVIFQFYPTTFGITNSREARLFVPYDLLVELGFLPTFFVSDQLRECFEPSDNRRATWIGDFVYNDETYYHVHKYKIYVSDEQIEFTVVLRLAEQYLIRAEARAHLGKVVGPSSAASDLNALRARAGLPNTAAVDAGTMFNAINHERRVELFGEWGHRWFDLIRTGRASEVLGSLKSDWTYEDALRPIPESDLNLNPYLIQNPGY